MTRNIGVLLCRTESGFAGPQEVGSRISNRSAAFLLTEPAPGLFQISVPFLYRNLSAGHHAEICAMSGSNCGAWWGSSGENPFSFFLVHISPENSTALRKIFLG